MNLSFLAGGLWVIPLLSFGGAVYFLITGYRESKSGSVVGKESQPSDINVPFLKCPSTKYGIALIVATIGILLWMYSDR